MSKLTYLKGFSFEFTSGADLKRSFLYSGVTVCKWHWRNEHKCLEKVAKNELCIKYQIWFIYSPKMKQMLHCERAKWADRKKTIFFLFSVHRNGWNEHTAEFFFFFNENKAFLLFVVRIKSSKMLLRVIMKIYSDAFIENKELMWSRRSESFHVCVFENS